MRAGASPGFRPPLRRQDFSGRALRPMFLGPGSSPASRSRPSPRFRFGNEIAVVNAGIAGNRILKPEIYSAREPDASGPAALQRLRRDVLSLSGVSAIIWLEGVNDLGPHGGATLEELEQAFTFGVWALRLAVPAIKVIGATLTSARGSADFGARERPSHASSRAGSSPATCTFPISRRNTLPWCWRMRRPAPKYKCCATCIQRRCPTSISTNSWRLTSQWY